MQVPDTFYVGITSFHQKKLDKIGQKVLCRLLHLVKLKCKNMKFLVFSAGVVVLYRLYHTYHRESPHPPPTKID